MSRLMRATKGKRRIWKLHGLILESPLNRCETRHLACRITNSSRVFHLLSALLPPFSLFSVLSRICLEYLLISFLFP